MPQFAQDGSAWLSAPEVSQAQSVEAAWKQCRDNIIELKNTVRRLEREKQRHKEDHLAKSEREVAYVKMKADNLHELACQQRERAWKQDSRAHEQHHLLEMDTLRNTIEDMKNDQKLANVKITAAQERQANAVKQAAERKAHRQDSVITRLQAQITSLHAEKNVTPESEAMATKRAERAAEAKAHEHNGLVIKLQSQIASLQEANLKPERVNGKLGGGPRPDKKDDDRDSGYWRCQDLEKQLLSMRSHCVSLEAQLMTAREHIKVLSRRNEPSCRSNHPGLDELKAELEKVDLSSSPPAASPSPQRKPFAKVGLQKVDLSSSSSSSPHRKSLSKVESSQSSTTRKASAQAEIRKANPSSPPPPHRKISKAANPTAQIHYTPLLESLLPNILILQRRLIPWLEKILMSHGGLPRGRRQRRSGAHNGEPGGGHNAKPASEDPATDLWVCKGVWDEIGGEVKMALGEVLWFLRVQGLGDEDVGDGGDEGGDGGGDERREEETERVEGDEDKGSKHGNGEGDKAENKRDEGDDHEGPKRGTEQGGEGRRERDKGDNNDNEGLAGGKEDDGGITRDHFQRTGLRWRDE